MKNSFLLKMSAVLTLAMSMSYGQNQPTPAKGATAWTPQTQKAVFTQYCQGCHNDKAKTSGNFAGLSLEHIDMAKAAEHAETLELAIRKIRAGMMPPAGMRRPDPATFESSRHNPAPPCGTSSAMVQSCK